MATAATKRIGGIDDPRERAAKAAAAMRRHQDEIDALRSIRDGAVDVMIRQDGVRPAEAARVIGVSRALLAKQYPGRDRPTG